MNRPTVLITGAAARLGKATAKAFFERGCNLVLHYNQSTRAAKALSKSFNALRPGSCQIVQADLTYTTQHKLLIQSSLKYFGRLDHLINNASIFYPTPFWGSDEQELNKFMNTNFFAPLNLAKLSAVELAKQQGSVINLLDIYAESGLEEHSCYTAAKSALLESTKQLALELAPNIRVNAVSPGAILWPEASTSNSPDQQKKELILENTALKRLGRPEDIAATTCYLALDASYSTGSLIKVDGGRRLYI